MPIPKQCNPALGLPLIISHPTSPSSIKQCIISLTSSCTAPAYPRTGCCPAPWPRWRPCRSAWPRPPTPSSAPTRAIRGSQWQSVAVRGSQGQSVAVSGSQGHSVAVSECVTILLSHLIIQFHNSHIVKFFLYDLIHMKFLIVILHRYSAWRKNVVLPVIILSTTLI